MTIQEESTLKLLELGKLFIEWLKEASEKTGLSEEEIQKIIKQFLIG